MQVAFLFYNMTIGIGILFQNRALLCIDQCQYTPEEAVRFHYNVTKYFKLSKDIFYVEGGLTNAARAIIGKLLDLKIDSFGKLSSIISVNTLVPIYKDFITEYSGKHADILRSPHFNYYSVIFAGRKAPEIGFFICCLNFSVMQNGDVNYNYYVNDTPPALFATPTADLDNKRELGTFYEEIKESRNIKGILRACAKTIENMSKKSPYISPWGVIIEINENSEKMHAFNKLKKLQFFISKALAKNGNKWIK